MVMGWLTTNHFGPWISWHSEWPFFLVGFLMSIGLMKRRGSLHGQLIFPSFTFPLLLLCSVALVQWLFQPLVSRGQTAVFLLYLLLAIVAVGWGANEGRVPGRKLLLTGKNYVHGEWFAWVLLLCALASCFVMFAQVFELWEGQSTILRMPFLRRPGANVGQSNHVATILAMAMGAVIYLAAFQRVSLATMTGALIFLSVGVAVTESRGGILSVLMLSILIACSPSIGCRRKRLGLAAQLAFFIGVAFLIWPTLYAKWDFAEVQTGGLTRIAQSTVDARWLIWSQLFEATLQKPYFGWGIRNTAVAMHSIASDVLVSFPVTYSHNVVLDFAVWVGWPITALIFMLFAAWGFKKQSARLSRTGFYGGALLIPFLVHSVLEFPFAYAYLLVPAMLGVGYIEAVTPTKVNLTWNRLTSILATVFMGVIGGISVLDYINIEEDFRNARFQILRIGPTSSEPLPNILILNQMDDLIQSMRLEIDPALEPFELDQLRVAALSNPWSGTQYRYALALALNGSRSEALQQLDVLYAQHGAKTEAALRRQIDEILQKNNQEPLPRRTREPMLHQ